LTWSYDFYLSFFNVMYHIYWFVCIIPSSHLRDKSHLIKQNDPFNVLLNLVCLLFVEDFCIYSHQGYSPLTSFSGGIIIWLLDQSHSSLTKGIWGMPLLQSFLRVWEGLVLSILYMFGTIQLYSHQVLDFYLFGNFF
jgi:hypothetical protein